MLTMILLHLKPVILELDYFIEAERKKEERVKEMRTTSETSGTMLNAPTFDSKESQKKKTKRKTMRKYLRR